MRDLYLKASAVEGGGIKSLEIEISWNDANILFDGFESLEGFDVVECSLQDGEQGKLLVTASNLNEDTTSECEFVKLKFHNTEAIEHDVIFLVGNTKAYNSDGEEIELDVVIADYAKPSGRWSIDGIWK